VHDKISLLIANLIEHVLDPDIAVKLRFCVSQPFFVERQTIEERPLQGEARLKELLPGDVKEAEKRLEERRDVDMSDNQQACVYFAALGKLHGKRKIYYDARDFQISKESGSFVVDVAAPKSGTPVDAVEDGMAGRGTVRFGVWREETEPAQ
jgi:hypothetical protein